MTAWDQRTPNQGETVVPPLTADQCKDGGWKTLDSGFKNQGQCVKLAITRK